MYTNSMIDEIITGLRNDEEKRNSVLDNLSASDARIIKKIILDGCAEDFDRYDSDVCESFLIAFESVTC